MGVQTPETELDNRIGLQTPKVLRLGVCKPYMLAVVCELGYRTEPLGISKHLLYFGNAE